MGVADSDWIVSSLLGSLGAGGFFFFFSSSSFPFPTSRVVRGQPRPTWIYGFPHFTRPTKSPDSLPDSIPTFPLIQSCPAPRPSQCIPAFQRSSVPGFNHPNHPTNQTRQTVS